MARDTNELKYVGFNSIRFPWKHRSRRQISSWPPLKFSHPWLQRSFEGLQVPQQLQKTRIWVDFRNSREQQTASSKHLERCANRSIGDKGNKGIWRSQLDRTRNCECRESQASSAGCRLWLPRALGKLSLFCFTTGRQLVIGCNTTDYALWITIESNNNPGLIMLMKPSFTSSNMIDSSGRWGRISSEPRKTFSKYLGHCVHYGWIYLPHLGTAFSTWFYLHTLWVYICILPTSFRMVFEWWPFFRICSIWKNT